MAKDDPTLQEMQDYLRSTWGDELDDMDRESAIYWFAAHYHSGQSSNLYEATCLSEYCPGPSESGPDSEGLALMAYMDLEKTFI